MRSPMLSIVTWSLCIAAAIPGSATAAPNQTTFVSVDVPGLPAPTRNTAPSVSATGRYIAYESDEDPLPRDPTHRTNVFVRDIETALSRPVNFDVAGVVPNGDSNEPAISGDGRWVAFTSSADNLVPGDDNAASDVYIRDLNTGDLELVSLNSAGIRGNAASSTPAISADGRFVVFASVADNLAPGDTNSGLDVFVRDRQFGLTERVSINAAGGLAIGQGGRISISADGHYVAFEANMIYGSGDESRRVSGIYVRDRVAGTTRTIREDPEGAPFYTSLGRISADGHFLLFSEFNSSHLEGRNQIYVVDMTAGKTEYITAVGDFPGAGFTFSISGDGRYVAYSEEVREECPCVGTVVVYDRQTGGNSIVSVNSMGVAANKSSGAAEISANGRRVAFVTPASNLSAADGDSLDDVYVHELPDNIGTVRINAGGGAFTDSMGNLWTADTGYNTGSVSSTSAPIAGTSDDGLYQNQRWDDTTVPDLQYSVPLDNGSYLVKLHFAEINTARASIGARVFDVVMEGKRVFDNVDVFREAGAINKALVKPVTVTVSDNFLNIAFQPEVRGGIVNAIEVVPVRTGGSAGVVVRTNVGGSQYTDTQGVVWAPDADANPNTGNVSTSTAPVAGTDDDPLYQSIRWDDAPEPELQYDYWLPAGEYTVRLLFVESNPKTAYAGARVFDVDIQGVEEISNLDVYSAAGGLNRAFAVSRTVTVNGLQNVYGALNIKLRHQVKNPILSAIEIVGR
ncbi:MAG: malectin domain-containing carbohydrate-binding protein [Steroidobacteraceae bacterium]